jgi:hypothetical protein
MDISTGLEPPGAAAVDNGSCACEGRLGKQCTDSMGTQRSYTIRQTCALADQPSQRSGHPQASSSSR